MIHGLIHWFVHEVLFQFIFLGFLFWKLGRGWLYPHMGEALDGEVGKARRKIARFIVIWRHFWYGHGTRHVLDCKNAVCAKL